MYLLNKSCDNSRVLCQALIYRDDQKIPERNHLLIQILDFDPYHDLFISQKRRRDR